MRKHGCEEKRPAGGLGCLRIYSQLGEYFGVAGKEGSWNGEKHLKRQSREGEELMKVKDNDRTRNNSEEYT